MTDAPNVPVRVAIVGAGMAGIAAARRLIACGEDSFIVLERADRIGGTWRDNRYPGVACDVPSHLYCFDFAANPDFSRKFASGAEILAYLQRTAQPVDAHIKTSTDMLSATWDDDAGMWRIETSAGPIAAQILVMACGRLTEPKHPQLPGSFDGHVVHTARWDGTVETRGARVAIVGTGASGVQITPTIVDRAASVVVLQRSAPHVLPRGDFPYSVEQRRRFRSEPAVLQRLRAQQFAEAESGHGARFRDLASRLSLAAAAQRHLHDSVADPELRLALTPAYEYGCKRPLFSDDYYPALSREHVSVEPAALSRWDGDAIVAENGARHVVDIVILATGFEAARQPYATRVRGRSQTRLDEYWREGMRAYASTTVHGFPNMFVLDGPHASLGHNSAILMIEAQITYMLDALATVGPGSTFEVRPEREAAYVEEMDRRSAASVWMSGCSNWYLDPRTGRQVLLWPGTVTEFQHRLAAFDVDAYVTKVHSCA